MRLLPVLLAFCVSLARAAVEVDAGAGVDNGVSPIDQMLVTVTKPIEETVNSVPGLDHLSSITSRGTAQIDLFFSWNVDMHRTLELVNAALARVQSTLPATAKLMPSPRSRARPAP